MSWRPQTVLSEDGRILEERAEKIRRRSATPADRLEHSGRITKAQAEAGRELIKLYSECHAGAASPIYRLAGRAVQPGLPGLVPRSVSASRRVEKARLAVGPMLWEMAWRVMVSEERLGAAYLAVMPPPRGDRLNLKDADQRGIGLLVAALNALVAHWRIIPAAGTGRIRAAYAESA